MNASIASKQVSSHRPRAAPSPPSRRDLRDLSSAPPPRGVSILASPDPSPSVPTTELRRPLLPPSLSRVQATTAKVSSFNGTSVVQRRNAVRKVRGGFTLGRSRQDPDASSGLTRRLSLSLPAHSPPRPSRASQVAHRRGQVVTVRAGNTNAQKAEYIWYDGLEGQKDVIFNEMRSKTKVIQKPIPAGSTAFPMWSFDGSSTGQAEGDDSDCLLRPVFSCPDPIRGDPHVLVLCEVLTPGTSANPPSSLSSPLPPSPLPPSLLSDLALLTSLILFLRWSSPPHQHQGQAREHPRQGDHERGAPLRIRAGVHHARLRRKGLRLARGRIPCPTGTILLRCR